MISGQQAAFGNVAAYSKQISPFGGGGPISPYGGGQGGQQGSSFAPTPLYDPYRRGSVAGADAISTAGGAAMLGLPLGGALMGGPVGGMMDPFTGGFRGAGSAVGWRSGAGLSANAGAIARGGIGMLGRGLAGAAVGAMPALAIGAGISHATDQMAQGARFHQHTSDYLQNQFRFSNAQSATGYGYTSQDRLSISGMLREQGHGDMMTSPQELLGVMKQGASQGIFRGAEDAREFRRRFKQMTDSLKEIAQELNTTMTDAMPFFQEARRQGFWTANDIKGYARTVHTTAYSTGMPTGQVQAMMGRGAMMARSIGATGAQGAQMMARSMQVAGSGTWGGVVGQGEMAEAGFGIGASGQRNLSNFLAGGTARFARSQLGRWVLAASMNKEGSGLDADRLNELLGGNMGIGRISRLARKNVGGEGGVNRKAYDFVLNEHKMRGQLASQGPAAQLGMIRSMLGDRLHGRSSRDRLVTRRIIQRFFGGGRRQADLVAKLARELPQIMEVQVARSESMLDSQVRTRDEFMNRSWGGWKKQAAQWFDENINGPLQEEGAKITDQFGRAFRRLSDKFWSRGRLGGPSRGAVREWANAAAMGKESLFFGGGADDMGGFSGTRRLKEADTGTMLALGYGGDNPEQTLLSGTFSAEFGTGDVAKARERLSAMGGNVGDDAARRFGFDDVGGYKKAMQGAVGKQLGQYMKSSRAIQLRASHGGGKLESDQQIYLARQYALDISRGRGGAGAELQAAIRRAGGGRSRAAGGMIMAMRSGASDRGWTDVVAPTIGLGTDSSDEEIAAAVGSRVKDLHGALSRDAYDRGDVSFLGALSGAGGLQGIGVKRDDLMGLQSDAAGARALVLLGAAKRAADGGHTALAKQHEEEAERMLYDVANRKGVSAGVRSAAVGIARAPSGGRTKGAAAGLGGAIKTREGKVMRATIRGRMERLRRDLGGETISAISGAGAVGRATAAALGDAATDPAQRRKILQGIARAAITGDKDEAARVRGLVGDRGDVGLVLRRAGEMRSAVERGMMGRNLAEGRTSRRAERGVSAVLRAGGYLGRGGPLGRGDTRDVVQGDLSKKDRDAMIEFDMQRYNLSRGKAEQRVDENLKRWQGGVTKKEGLVEDLSKAAAASGIRTYHKDVAKDMGYGAEFAKRLAEMSGTGRKSRSEQLDYVKIGLLEKLVANTGVGKTKDERNQSRKEQGLK